MTEIKGQRFGQERALYHTQNAVISDCRFEGEEDGESALKESSNITVKNCFMDLRYPLWHVNNLKLSKSTMTENCRAALWYCNRIEISDCTMNGIKAIRECADIRLKNVNSDSPEFGWRSRDIEIQDCTLQSQYAFFESRNIRAKNFTFGGKYSFQYTENVEISHSKFDTKDAFWHAKNVTVTDSDIKGEYLGWYSENLTFIRCRIKGTQPLCYCKNLILVDCVMEDCDLSFEYSDVDADVKGTITSVKNPLSGKIVADGFGEIILKDSVYPTGAQIIKRK